MDRSLRLALGLVFVLSMPSLVTVGCVLGRQQACDGDSQCTQDDPCADGGCKPKTCVSDEECGTSTDCATYRCVNSACETKHAPAGPLPAEKQATGDCFLLKCDGQGSLVKELDTNDVPPSSGAPCTVMSCTAAGPVEGTAAPGDSCNLTQTDQGVCSNTGACVECIANESCTVGDHARCLENSCVSCDNGLQDADETGVDCGGACSLQCTLGTCTVGADCKSLSCREGLCRVTNGNDCASNAECMSYHCVSGTSTKKCQACSVNSPCSSGTCTNGICSAP